MAVGGGAVGVAVGIAACVSAITVLTEDKAVSIASVGFVLGAGIRLLHEVNATATKNKGTIVLLMIFTFPLPFMFTSNYISYGIISTTPDAQSPIRSVLFNNSCEFCHSPLGLERFCPLCRLAAGWDFLFSSFLLFHFSLSPQNGQMVVSILDQRFTLEISNSWKYG
jgi:hypothetical protein